MDLEEGVGLLGDTGVGVVPGEEGSEETKDTTSLDEAGVGDTGGHVWADEMPESEEEEGEIEGEEEREEGDGGLHGAEEEDKGEDEPAHEVEAKDILEFSWRVGVWDTEGGGVDDGPRDPEATVGGESGGSKGVAASHFPHTSEKLDQSTVAIGQSDNDSWSMDAASVQVEERKDECGKGESREAERSWVGELPEGWLIWCDLHITTEWWEELSVSIHEDLADWSVCWMVDSVVWSVGQWVVLVEDRLLLDIVVNAVVHGGGVSGVGH